MHQVQPLVVAGFIEAGHNMGDDLSDAEAGAFITEKSLDTAIGAVVPAKDKPHLTLNDKVYAARFGSGATPKAADAPSATEPEPEPEPELEVPVEETTTTE